MAENGKNYVTHSWLVMFVLNVLALGGAGIGFLHYRDVDRIEAAMEKGFDRIEAVISAAK